jgi:hypothetical protein
MTDSILTDSIPPRAGDLQFPPGRVVATPGALLALTDVGVLPHELLARHLRGDWGDAGGHDRRENGRALAQGRRLFSSYAVGEDVRVWIITEPDRTATTLLLPDEY